MSDDWEKIVRGAVRGGIGGIGDEVERWIKRWRQRKPIKILDEELRWEQHRFREVATLAAAIGDETKDHAITKELLKHMGAKHNKRPGGRDTWWMPKYWEQDAAGSGTSDGGKWKLRKGIKPARL